MSKSLALVQGQPKAVELFKLAAEALGRADEHGVPLLSQIALVLPWPARGHRVRLAKFAGPWGHIANVKADETVAYFEATEVCSYLIKIGAITRIERVENPDDVPGQLVVVP